jgi:DNA gyrase/topoisomerase IV subunit B
VIVIFNLPLRGKILNVEKAMHQVFWKRGDKKYFTLHLELLYWRR